jgi:ATP-dependent helicase Lhr and Lhr-like helicase
MPFHPLVRQWFEETLGAPSAPQVRGWPAIASGAHTLILAPTGTGKTLAAFLWELNALIERGQQGDLPNAVQILYVSPLKALGNDVHVNLERPLAQLRERFEAAGEAFPDIRVAVRSGDTSPSARARMLRQTPHILITTPESLSILLTTERGRGIFPGVRAVIVDEIHAVAGGKRGSHLALTLERLDALCQAAGTDAPQRIGLSATQRPLDEVARFLGGCEPSGEFRNVTIVDCGLVKPMDVKVQSPVPDLARVDGSVWPAVAELALQAIRGARTTLVFVNNRGQAERMASRINTLAGAEIARPYHGSLAKERRLALERALKAGEVRALVTTSALELGIDIGSIDLVLQLQSPKRVSAAVQRIGRAGHSIGDISRGVIVPTFRDDLVESVALVGAVHAGEVEPTRVPQNALDVLAQTLVAVASSTAGPSSPDVGTTADDAFRLVRSAYPYHRLSRAAFDETLAMVSGKYPSELAAELQPRITWDRTTGRITGTRGSRMTAVISGGTIPDRGLYTVNLPDRTRLGELDEEFVHESRVGDVFQLGSSTWRISVIEHDRVIVTPAPGAPARMPFWHGEFMARSVELSKRVGALRREVTEGAVAADGGESARLGATARRVSATAATSIGTPAHSIAPPDGGERADGGEIARQGVTAPRVSAPAATSISTPAHSIAPPDGNDDSDAGEKRLSEKISDEEFAALHECDVSSARTLRNYVAEQRAATGVVPDDRTFVVESFRDELDAVRVVIHAPVGGRVTAPWGMALAQRARELLGGTTDIQVQTSDDGLMLRLPNLGGEPPVRALFALTSDEARRRVLDEVGSTPLFGARFRMNAARSLLLPRGIGHKRMPLWLQRLRASDLLETVRQFPSFPILVETYREVLQDAFDLDALTDVLTALTAGQLAVHYVATDRPSPFASGLQFGFVMDWLYVDDTPRAERAAASLAIDQELLDDIMGGIGSGDPVADAALQKAIDEVVAARQGTAPGRQARTPDELAHWLSRAGDLTPEELRQRVAPPERWIDAIDPMDTLLSSGRAVAAPAAWGRIVLAEDVPRYERAQKTRDARREILARYLAISGPVTLDTIHARYPWPPRWIEARLAEWEDTRTLVRGVFPGTDGAVAWSSRRVIERARRRALAALRAEIDATDLPTFAAFLTRWQHLDPRDRLTGEPGVARALEQLDGLPRPGLAWERDYLPSRVTDYDQAWLAHLATLGAIVWAGAPPGGEVRFFARGEGALWVTPAAIAAHDTLSENAQAVRAALERGGAAFLTDLEAATSLTPFRLRDAIRELVAAGLVTNDTIEAMREVVRTPRPATSARVEPDPTRWLPADYTPSAGRRIVSHRPTSRRLPRWRRPDRPGATHAGWVGRWSLVATPGTLGPTRSEEEQAAAIARRWLDRYGIVTRDWWSRERPAVAWRPIYRELRRMEMRGEVRRGYFVSGLAGAQFALPEAVERLRAAREDPDAPWVVVAASDPANPYRVVASDPFNRPRGSGALLVMRRGRVALAVEGRGSRVRIAPEVPEADVTAAAAALATYLARRPSRSAVRRPSMLDTIDGGPATTSQWSDAFRAAGYRRGGTGLEYPDAFTPV